MKILQICPRIPSPPADGGAVYIYYMSKHLSLLGHEITMATFHSNKHLQDAADMEQYVDLHYKDGRFKPYNIGAVLKSTLRRKPVSIDHRMSPEIMEANFKEISDRSFDVVLLEGIHAAEFLPLVKQYFPDVPTVLRQSNVEYVLLRRNGDTQNNPLLKQFYYDQARLMRAYEKRSMEAVDAVTAITDVDLKYYLQDVPGLRCFVSNAGTEIPDIQVSERKRRTLLSISNWRWLPNFEGLRWFLDHVFPELEKKYPDIRYQVIGEGLSERFKNRYKDLHIDFLGYVDDIEPYRQSAAMLVAPLFSGSGMKLKVVEALASGLPVITTSIGAEGIDMESGRHYLHAEQAHDYSEQISRLIDDPELCKSISGHARQLAIDKFSWKQKAQELERFLKESLIE